MTEERGDRVLSLIVCAAGPAKWGQGISDTYALGVLADITGLDVPIVVLPFVNSALASRVPFRRGVETLRSEGVPLMRNSA